MIPRKETFDDPDEQVRAILSQPVAVAVVGMSPRLERPSRAVGLYLARAGFTVIPVHPTAEQVAGLRAYPRLEDVPREARVAIVDVCVAAERAGNIAQAAANIGARVVWFQPGAENPAEETRARQLGLLVISGRCIMADHRRLYG
ncbi:MAG: CoA-binding protein [Candidatus Sumerlaeia bacterium]|nr:CoA-binding protein [Candidatus Sumerlaeia bacterium]